MSTGPARTGLKPSDAQCQEAGPWVPRSLGRCSCIPLGCSMEKVLGLGLVLLFYWRLDLSENGDLHKESHDFPSTIL